MANFIVFDLEASCGWLHEERQSEIIEIGAVKINERLEIVDEFQSFIRPQINPELTDFCRKLTTIEQSDVDNAEIANKVIPNFRRWCGVVDTHVGPISNTPFWLCSWGHYDRRMLRQDCEHWGIPSDWTANHISIKHQHGAMMVRELIEQGVSKSQYKQVSKGIGMERALSKLGIPMEGTHHRAISDAKNIAKIFIELFPRLEFKRSN